MKKAVSGKGFLALLVAIKLLYSTAFAVTFISIIFPLYPTTRHRYKDYETFRQKTNTAMLTDIMPDSAEPEYYFHSVLFKRQSGYRVRLSDDDYDRLKKDAGERYLSYQGDRPKTGSLYIGAPGGTAELPDNDLFDKEDTKFIYDKLIRSDEGFYIMYDFTIDGSPKDYRIGMMCNDSTNEIIEFFVRRAEVD